MGTHSEKAYYSTVFKKSLVSRIEAGELSVIGAMRKYQIGGSMTVYRWLSRYGSEASGSFMSENQPITEPTMKPEEEATGLPKSGVSAGSRDYILELESRLVVLERMLESERLRSEAYLQMIKIAEAKYQIPIEKKSGAKQSKR